MAAKNVGDIACATLAAFVAAVDSTMVVTSSRVHGLVLLADEEFTRGTNIWLQLNYQVCAEKNCFSNFLEI